MPYVLRTARGDARTYAAFGELFAHACDDDAEVYQVDCSQLSFFDSSLSAAIAVLHTQLIDRGKKLQLNGLNPRVRAVLNDTGLFGTRVRRQRDSLLPLMHFAEGEGDRFDLYARRGLIGRGLPRMSKDFEDEFFRGIHELFVNFEIHAESRRGLWMSGQLFPSLGRVQLTLADHGIGIPAKVQARGYAPDAPSAIAWAMTGNNTTRVGDVPGGLGLKLLREFVKVNKGELVITSHCGHWRQSGAQVGTRPLVHPYPGTAVTISVSIYDGRRYRSPQLTDAGTIF